MSDIPPGAGSSSGGPAKQVAQQGTQAAGQAAGEVKDTAKDQAQRVASEAGAPVRSVASEVRDRVSMGARTQNDKLVSTIRQTADQLDEMRGDRADSPAATVVSRVAEGGRQFADYLDRNGPDGVLEEVQEFARRRPGTFLATALVAGFVVGRLGKGVVKADPQAGKPRSDSFVSQTPPAYPASQTPPAYPADPVYADANVNTGTTYTPGTSSGYPPAGTTEYAATGTGTPEPLHTPEPRP